MNHIKRWRYAMIALDAQDNPVGIIYMSDGHSPYPSVKTPVQVTQRATETTLDHMAHRQIAQQVMRDHQNGLLAAKRSS